jgi:hypothetical protein
LHLRAILSLPIFEITLEKQVATAASWKQYESNFHWIEKLPVSLKTDWEFLP